MTTQAAEAVGDGEVEAVLHVRDAAEGQVLETVPRATEAEVAEAISRAKEAQLQWASTPVAARAKALRRCAEALTAERDALVDRVVRELGLCATEALMLELLPAVSAARWCAERGPAALEERRFRPHLWAHREAVVRGLPRGVVAVLSSWNAALALPLSVAFSALMAGNAVVLKPSPRASGVVAAALRALSGALPAGLLSVVYGDRRVADALIDGAPDLAVFLGAAHAGRRVAARCAAGGVPVLLSVCGSAPAIVCRDADLERTARALVAGRFAHAGQRRGSVERVYVHARVHDALVARVVTEAKALRVGDPSRRRVDMGPLLEHRRVDVLAARSREAVLHGARLECGGARVGDHGGWFAPTVLSECRPGMALLREPLRGPVLPVVKVADEAEAMAVCAEPAPGPVAYVFSDSEERASAVAAGLDAGTVLVNDVMSPEQIIDAPMGSEGHGSTGRLLGVEGLVAMTRTQHLGLPVWSELSRDPWWPPHGAGREGLLRRAVALLYGRLGFVGRIDDLK